MDTTDPPGGEKPVVDYLKQVLEAEGIPVQIFAKEAAPPQPGRAHQGHRQAAAAAADGAHRHGQRRSEEVDASAVLRRSRRRLRLRPRHRRRQGQRRRDADDDADAEAPERAARSRRDRAVRSRRRRLVEPRHPVHGQRALRRDRRGVLLRRGRQRHAHRRRGEVRVGPDGREDSARDHGDLARRRRPRLGAARRQRARAPRRSGRQDRGVDAADAHQRDDRGVLQAAGVGVVAGRGRSAIRRCSVPIRKCPGRPTTTCARTSRATGRCCARRCRRR